MVGLPIMSLNRHYTVMWNIKRSGKAVLQKLVSVWLCDWLDAQQICEAEHRALQPKVQDENNTAQKKN